MNEHSLLTYIYGIPFLISLIVYMVYRNKRERGKDDIRIAEIEAGLTEPASIHPLIDYAKCIGCGTCVTACPEKNVLAVIGNKAELISPTHCIGHSACKAGCPVDAITLVFGTSKRGLDIPNVKPNFETNVPGIFIAGELGGMGLIRNAVTQGREAIEYIRDAIQGKTVPGASQVLIVGAGPAGISASLACIENKLSYVTLEQETMGGTVAHYPRGKVVMTQPAKLPMFGPTTFTETTKEKLLAFWEEVIRKTGVVIKYSERVEKVERQGNVFVVKTQKGEYKSQYILLSIGRRGTPRKLGVPGEDKDKVVYSLTDPEQYAGKHVVVVGGGDSALEAAASIAECEGTTVTLSYRSESFGRAKQKNRDRVKAGEARGKLKVMLKSTIVEIRDADLTMDWDGTKSDIKNDAVIVCAGGILPTGFLKDMGIQVETKYGTE